jgi:hypothetical protein
MSNFQFTRYLYAADEVRAALTVAILNKADDAALFWAYELFHSDYDLMAFFWKLYYDFYATLNPAFEKYLNTKFKLGLTEPKLVATIVGNFVIRPHNMDIFLLTKASSDDKAGASTKKPLDLASSDYYATAAAVMSNQVTIEQVISHYAALGVKLNPPKIVSDFEKQTVNVAPNLLLLTRLMQYESKLKKLKMGKNMYIQVEDTDVEPYATLRLKQPRKILSTVGLLDIDEQRCIGGLFQLTRDTADIVTAYRDDWLYAASFSPLWKARITGNNGTINEEAKEVTFADDESLEQFYEKYGLEPDEQRLEVQQKSTGVLSKGVTWSKFYSKNGLVKEQVLGKVVY